MKICIRAHDLGVKGTQAILRRIQELGIHGVQMVCYKAYDEIPYAPFGIDEEKAARIGEAFRQADAMIPLVGAYFNPVHSNQEKVDRGIRVFEDYLKVCKAMGCSVVGSETGSFNDDKWTYHPQNRTEEALRQVVRTFSGLCDVAARHGSTVAMEGAAGHVCWNVQTLARARRLIGKPTKVIFDLYNYLDESNQKDYLAILEEGLHAFHGEILLFHMKDCCFTENGRPRQVPFGTGDMDLKEVLRRIKAYDENAILTLEGTTGDHIPLAVAAIKEIWGEI